MKSWERSITSLDSICKMHETGSLTSIINSAHANMKFKDHDGTKFENSCLAFFNMVFYMNFFENPVICIHFRIFSHYGKWILQFCFPWRFLDTLICSHMLMFEQFSGYTNHIGLWITSKHYLLMPLYMKSVLVTKQFNYHRRCQFCSRNTQMNLLKIFLNIHLKRLYELLV